MVRWPRRTARLEPYASFEKRRVTLASDLYVFMTIARERTTIEKKSSPDSVEKMDHMAMSTNWISARTYQSWAAVTTTARSILLKMKRERESDYLHHIKWIMFRGDWTRASCVRFPVRIRRNKRSSRKQDRWKRCAGDDGAPLSVLKATNEVTADKRTNRTISQRLFRFARF